MVAATLREVTGGDEELLQQLIADLCAGLSKSIELMRGAETDHEFREFAHRLKGGALTIGSDSIATLAKEAEADVSRREEWMASIDAAFAEEFGPEAALTA